MELAERKYGRSDIDNLIAEGIIEYTYDWSDKAISIPRATCSVTNQKIMEMIAYDPNLTFGSIDHIQRQYAGSELKEHVDEYADPSIVFAAIVYVNDDYVDGHLYFSNLNVKTRPKAKSMMIFPGSELYKHGVSAPGEGPTRYVLPTFIRK